MATEAVEARARELYAALYSTSVAVLDETANIVQRERLLGRLTDGKLRRLRRQLRALGWKHP